MKCNVRSSRTGLDKPRSNSVAKRLGAPVPMFVTVLLLAVMAIGSIPPWTPFNALAADFEAGDSVEVVDGALNLRQEPGLSAEIIRVLPDRYSVTVIGGPQTKDGYEWYEITYHEDGHSDGWVAGQFLAHHGPSGAFEQFDGVRVVDGRLNLRNGPALSFNVIRVLDEGTAMVITNGPESQDGYGWYEVFSYEFGSGWVAGDYLVADPAVTSCEGQGPCPPTMVDGDGIRVVTDYLNLRSNPSISAKILDVLPYGTTALFTGDSDYAEGYGWIEIESDVYGTGWVARQFVVLDPSVTG